MARRRFDLRRIRGAALFARIGAARRERAAFRHADERWHDTGNLGRAAGRRRNLPPRRLSRGIDVISPRVYGWRGRANSAFTDASSTLRPAYITTTRCAVSAITPRSCVMSMTAAPVRSFISSIRSRICAWIVTSSAVVGSSAMRMRRRASHRDRDHHALAHAAGKLMRIFAGAPPRHPGSSRA